MSARPMPEHAANECPGVGCSCYGNVELHNLPTAENDAPRCRTCMGSGWTGSRHDTPHAYGHFHCPCGAPCAVDRAEGCTGATPIPPVEYLGGVGHGEDTIVIFHGDPVDDVPPGEEGRHE